MLSSPVYVHFSEYCHCHINFFPFLVKIIVILVPVVLLNKVSWLVEVPFLIICFAQCEGIQGSLGVWIPRHGFRILGTGFQSLSVELAFWIPIANGIPDPLSCIPDSKAQDSGFHMQIFRWFRIPDANFSGFQIPNANFSRIPDSTSKNFPDSGIRIPLHWAI